MSDSESTLSIASIHFLDDGDIPDADADSTLPCVEEDKTMSVVQAWNYKLKRLYVILFHSGDIKNQYNPDGHL